MPNSEVLLILCLFLVILIQFGAFLILVKYFQTQLRQEKMRTTDLLNRLTSGDLKTYQTMTRLTTSSESKVSDNDDNPIHPMTDAEEIKRSLMVHGLGEPIYDEETRPEDVLELMRDLGVDPGYGTNIPS